MLQNVVPYFPLSSKDMESVLKKSMTDISTRFEHLYWKRLEVHETVYQHFTDPDYVEYLQLTTATSSSRDGFIFAKRGAHDLDDNVLLQALKALMTRGYFNQAKKIARIDYLKPSNELVLSWCSENLEGGEDIRQCDEGWKGSLD